MCHLIPGSMHKVEGDISFLINNPNIKNDGSNFPRRIIFRAAQLNKRVAITFQQKGGAKPKGSIEISFFDSLSFTYKLR